MKKNYLLSADAAFLLADKGGSDENGKRGKSGGEGGRGKNFMRREGCKGWKGGDERAGGKPI